MNNNLLLVDGRRQRYNLFQKIWIKLHLDFLLLVGLLALAAIGFGILYSASSQSLTLLSHQLVSFAIACVAMCVFAQIPMHRYQSLVPWVYGAVLLMLLAVMSVGVVNKGAQRWLNFGLLRFQPSEIMKLAMPMMLAWYLRNKVLPLRAKDLFFSCLIIVLPVIIIAKQPDLGTALLVAATGVFVLLLAGITWKLMVGIVALLTIAVPVVWHYMHAYQKARLFTFLAPEHDPYGRGYNIIQSKIAIGSGGWFGKGWLLGTQTHLQFLPEHSTDFIFAVCGEEFGFIGCILLIVVFLYIIGRGLYISVHAQDTFSRLLAGSLILSFFISVFVNIGMVIGVLPVVGVPLPLVSYGGSSLVIFMSGFGIIMSTYVHRKLISS
ncbi:MAG: rod shape-determining protein [uncultured bacterium]|nr:MAG: rod shape-determining protein [uncultured bacterium]